MDEQSLSAFGKRLKEVRNEQNMTVRDLAKSVGLSEATISRYENGIVEPKRTTIRVFAEVFGVSPAWLLGYRDAAKYLTPAKTAGPRQVPLVGQIAAGQPILADENIESYEYISESTNVDFCLRVRGDSMIGARIFDGDLVFIRKQPEVENGEIAAVIIDGEATLKRVYKVNGTLILRPENPQYQDLVLSKRDQKEISIVGKAVLFQSEVR